MPQSNYFIHLSATFSSIRSDASTDISWIDQEKAYHDIAEIMLMCHVKDLEKKHLSPQDARYTEE